MSGKPAAIPLFADAYLADTMHLSTEEHGAYLLLLMAAWRQDDCSLPNDDRKLARIAGLSVRKWNAIKDTILEFWTIEGDSIFQPRLRKERTYVQRRGKINSDNARKRWDAQGTENIEDGKCDRTSERISERDAPPPPPTEEETEVSSLDAPARRAPKRAVKLPTDWEPVLTPTAQRIVDGWPPGKLGAELQRFRDHAADKGRVSKDWQAAFRTWLTKADEWMRRDGRSGQPRGPQPRSGDGSVDYLLNRIQAGGPR